MLMSLIYLFTEFPTECVVLISCLIPPTTYDLPLSPGNLSPLDESMLCPWEGDLIYVQVVDRFETNGLIHGLQSTQRRTERVSFRPIIDPSLNRYLPLLFIDRLLNMLDPLLFLPDLLSQIITIFHLFRCLVIGGCSRSGR